MYLQAREHWSDIALMRVDAGAGDPIWKQVFARPAIRIECEEAGIKSAVGGSRFLEVERRPAQALEAYNVA